MTLVHYSALLTSYGMTGTRIGLAFQSHPYFTAPFTGLYSHSSEAPAGAPCASAGSRDC